MTGTQSGTQTGAPLLVCCGLATLDVLQVVDRLPGPDEKVVAHELDVTFGGPAANAAAVAAELGVRVRLVTAIGSGPVAELVRQSLLESGVEVVDLVEGEPWSPAVSSVLVTRGTGDRAVVSVNASRVADLGARVRAQADDLLAGAGVLLVDGHHLGAAVELAARARAAGVRVVLDGGSWKPGLGDLLAHVDHAVLSADFRLPHRADPTGRADLTGRADPTGRADLSDRAGLTGRGGQADLAHGVDAADLEDPAGLVAVAATGPGVVARSAGPGPLRYLLQDGTRGLVRPPSVPTEQIVDTLGAGDVLHGAYVAALVRGADVASALEQGVRAASESVRRRGVRAVSAPSTRR